jgi:hypothetical protein
MTAAMMTQDPVATAPVATPSEQTAPTAPPDARPVYRDRAKETVIGLVSTPLAAIAGGFALNLFLAFPKFRVETATDILSGIAFYGLFGSFFACPTTLFGLPVVSVYVPRALPARPLVLAFAGFVLGWLTMMVWSLLFFGPNIYGRLQYAYASRALASFCFVGAACGALTGLAMGLLTRWDTDQDA